MGLLGLLFGSPRRPKRRRTARRRPSTARRDVSRQRKQIDEAARRKRELDREADRWIRADNRRRKQDQDRERRLQQREQRSETAREARDVARVLRQHERAVGAYMASGLTRSEAEEMADRYSNPRSRRRKSVSRRRNPSTRVALGAAARSMRGGRARNPFWGDVAKGVLTGLLTEEAKGVRQKAAGPFGQVKPKRKKNPPRRTVRKNPATLVSSHPDPKLRQMSQRFHGRPDQIVQLGEDQRRAAPKYAVLVGREEAIAYRPPRGSQRGGSVWEHSAGETRSGGRTRGRRLVVADRNGNTYVVRGTSRMKWDPDAGLVG